MLLYSYKITYAVDSFFILDIALFFTIKVNKIKILVSSENTPLYVNLKEIYNIHRINYSKVINFIVTGG